MASMTSLSLMFASAIGRTEELLYLGNIGCLNFSIDLIRQLQFLTRFQLKDFVTSTVDC